jgi:hypothetical protein
MTTVIISVFALSICIILFLIVLIARKYFNNKITESRDFREDKIPANKFVPDNGDVGFDYRPKILDDFIVRKLYDI